MKAVLLGRVETLAVLLVGVGVAGFVGLVGLLTGFIRDDR